MREIFIGERYIENRRYGYYLLAESGDITVAQRDIQALGALLMNGSVTPAALRDVVEDWLARD